MFDDKEKNPIIPIAQDKYNNFYNLLKQIHHDGLVFQSFKEKTFCDLITKTCSNIFKEEIQCIIELLNDPSVSIAVIDVPENHQREKSLEMILGSAVVFGIFCNIGSPNIEPINKLPFSIHTASHTNSENLNNLGLDHNSLEVKQGFHNDGLLSDNLVEIPNHILVYNLHIGYEMPGNFFWVPTLSWNEAEKFGAFADKNCISVNVKLTPSYYRDGDTIKNSVPEYLKIPICLKDNEGKRKFFLNGHILLENNPQEYVDFVNEIRVSIEKCPKKFSIPQRERRGIYLRNTMGFHARDIFHHPIEGVDLTRVFLRVMDLNAEKYFAS